MSPNPHFVGRQTEIEQVWETLDSRSVLLVGPRRIGKTELLKHMAERPPAHTKAVFVDLQGQQTVDGAFDRLLLGLTEAGLAVANPRAPQIQKGGAAGVAVEWQRPTLPTGWTAIEVLVADTFRAYRTAESRRLVLFLDEVPWWLDGLRRSDPQVAREALARLRFLRNLSPDLRMVLTGSIGLAGLAQDLQASAEINDVLPVTVLGPLSPLEGAGLFEAMVTHRGRKSTPEANALAARIGGGSPHWIRTIADKCTGSYIAEDAVLHAVETLLSPQNRALFADEAGEHLVRRHGAVEGAILRAMLSAAALANAGAPKAALLTAGLASAREDVSNTRAEQLLLTLQDEFYLERAGDGYAFSLPLFQLWWQRWGGGA